MATGLILPGLMAPCNSDMQHSNWVDPAGPGGPVQEAGGIDAPLSSSTGNSEMQHGNWVDPARTWECEDALGSLLFFCFAIAHGGVSCSVQNELS
jgi:hypothetical protein